MKRFSLVTKKLAKPDKIIEGKARRLLLRGALE
jgi:hypothetical protein